MTEEHYGIVDTVKPLRGEAGPIFTDQELDDIFNALNMLRNVSERGWSADPKMVKLAEEYEKGTVGWTRTGKLYKKMEELAKLVMYPAKELV